MEELKVELNKSDNDIKNSLKIIKTALRNRYILCTLMISFLIGFTPLPIVAYWWVYGDLSNIQFGRSIYYATLIISIGINQFYIFKRMKRVKLELSTLNSRDDKPYNTSPNE